MKKIGIITLYYKNNNYGGVAQAYALNKYFLNEGYNSELITYKKEISNLDLLNKNRNIKLLLKRIVGKLRRIVLEIIERKYRKKYENKLKIRAEKLEEFRNTIPHSKIYDKNNIYEIVDKYDYYVTGSDQCWNPGLIVGSYVFDFLDNKKNIFSYASSIAVSEFSEKYKKYMKKELKKYRNISVRENDSAMLLEKVIGKKVEFVVDPTLLLDRKEWEKITTKRVINEDYVFAYILGDDKKTRNKVRKIAIEKNLKLVTLPYIKNGVNFTFKLTDLNFGDEQMLDISFSDFLSLIKYSKYVITDSFHAICFSYIFKKEFMVLDKKGLVSTTSRIKSLLEQMGLSERLLTSSKSNINFSKIDYDSVDKKIIPMINYSKSYLKKSLGENTDK